MPTNRHGQQTLQRRCAYCDFLFFAVAAEVRRGNGLYCSRGCAAAIGRARKAQRVIPLIERFWSKVDKTENCWEWTGALTPNGYGRLAHEGAHRVAYRLTYGDFDQGLFVCHRCDNPKCVRPDHLFLGTQFDNMRDCSTKGRRPDLVRNPWGVKGKPKPS
jgi:hypothetical protein